MIKSMTGFGRGYIVQNGFGITVEMRSVNHRYADFILRLPREFYLLEDRIRHILKQKIERGRLEVTVILEAPPPGTRAVKIDYSLAEELCRAFTALTGHLPLKPDVNTFFTVLLPEIVSIEHSSADEEAIWGMVKEALQQALAELMERRRQEGAVLVEDIAGRCRRLEQLVAEISSRAPVIYEDYRRRLEKKLQEALGPVPLDENRVIMECALLVERAGIDEELVRLRSHLQAFQDTLEGQGQGAVGRRLDFIAQEMFRESTTIGAKAIDSGLAGLVVEVKTEVEKIREQIQNIE